MFRQEKVAKKKATPAYAVGYADSLALLEAPGGCGTRGYAPQTVLADDPRPFSAAQRFRWGPREASQFAGSTTKKILMNLTLCSGPVATWLPEPFRIRRFTLALCVVEQRRRGGGCRLALSEPQASSCKPPAPPSSAEYPATPGDKAGSPFLCLLYFGEAKESKSPVNGETQR